MSNELNNNINNNEQTQDANGADAMRDVMSVAGEATVITGETDAVGTVNVTNTTSTPNVQGAQNDPAGANFVGVAATVPAESTVPTTDAESDNTEKEPEEKDVRVSVIRAIFTWILIIVAAMFAAWFVRSYVLTPYEIPSGSMEHTLEIGDRVFAERVSYLFTEPKQGDIITFMDPETKDKKVHRTLIKRVVATEGQTVELIGGTLYVDGEPQMQDYVVGKSEELTEVSPDADLEFPFTVPEGHVFVMGDNRENSADSRYFGAIPVDTIYGHAIITYWPFDRLSLL